MQNHPLPRPSIFLRPASGLVKAVGLWDVFIYNVGLISLGIGVAYTQRYGPAYYSAGSIVVATLLSAGIMALVTLGFWAWTITIPRSGGIYVFLTRAGFPAFGFALSFVECISWLFYVAIAAKLVTTVAIIPLVALIFGSSNSILKWLSGSPAQLIIGTTTIVFAAWLLITGTRAYIKIQRLVFIFALVGTFALLFVLIGGDAQATFQANFNTAYSYFGSEPYSRVLDQARSLGWNTSAYSFKETVSLLVWPFLPLIGCAFSIGIGGEVRNTKRNQLIGMLGSLFFSAFGFIVIAILGDKAIGTSFQGAIAFNYDHASLVSNPATTAFEPYFPYLAGLATNSNILRILISLGFLCWVWFWIPGVLAFTERAFLAWALDRAAPAPLGTLHSRFGTPYVAVITGAIIAETFLILILFTQYFATLVFILAATVAWCITLAFGTAFPLIRHRLFSRSPIAGRKIAGIQLMTLFCFLGACALAAVIYLLWNDSLAAGHSRKSVIAVGITFTAGFVFHLLLRVYRRHQGVDLSQAYKEIPVE